MDKDRSLVKLMAREGFMPSSGEENERENVIRKLKKIVLEWVKEVAWQRRLREEEAYATILTFGSYGLGVHVLDSDIDALCVGPDFATTDEDFFKVLHKMLKRRPEVSEIYNVKDANVPLMRFKFDGISIDLLYGRFPRLSVPRNVGMIDPFSSSDFHEIGWNSLSGVRVNKRILKLVPDKEIFRMVLRCIKAWAKRRGVYGNLQGFLGGVQFAILVARVCQNHPRGILSTLVANFFKTYASWPWPEPVILDGPVLAATGGGRPSETRYLMPIRLPCLRDYCHSNITRSTFDKIRTEFRRGHDLMRRGLDWHSLFKRFPYSETYTRFLEIYLSASSEDKLGEWVGKVKSRFPSLIIKIEGVQCSCDPNPKEYIDMDVRKPHVVFYWGLQYGRSNFRDKIKKIEKDFSENIYDSYQGSGRMVLTVVSASRVPK